MESVLSMPAVSVLLACLVKAVSLAKSGDIISVITKQNPTTPHIYSVYRLRGIVVETNSTHNSTYFEGAELQY